MPNGSSYDEDLRQLRYNFEQLRKEVRGAPEERIDGVWGRIEKMEESIKVLEESRRENISERKIDTAYRRGILAAIGAMITAITLFGWIIYDQLIRAAGGG